MHRFLIWVLLFATLHVPVLMPDMDGECRGTPIESLVESQAWHPVLLGVRPNDDIDRGPIHSDSDRQSSFDGSQFGELAILRDLSICKLECSACIPSHPLKVGMRSEEQDEVVNAPSLPPPLAAGPVRILYCVWQV